MSYGEEKEGDTIESRDTEPKASVKACVLDKGAHYLPWNARGQTTWRALWVVCAGSASSALLSCFWALLQHIVKKKEGEIQNIAICLVEPYNFLVS